MWAMMSNSSRELVEPDYASLELLFSVPPTAPKEKMQPKIKKAKEVLGLRDFCRAWQNSWKRKAYSLFIVVNYL